MRWPTKRKGEANTTPWQCESRAPHNQHMPLFLAHEGDVVVPNHAAMTRSTTARRQRSAGALVAPCCAVTHRHRRSPCNAHRRSSIAMFHTRCAGYPIPAVSLLPLKPASPGAKQIAPLGVTHGHFRLQSSGVAADTPLCNDAPSPTVAAQYPTPQKHRHASHPLR